MVTQPPTFGPSDGKSGEPVDPSGPPPYAGGPPPPPPQYGAPPQYGPPPQYGAPPQYGPPPQYWAGAHQYGAPQLYPPQPYYAQYAPKPGCVPIRPLGVGDILDGSFTAMRRNPRTTLGLSAVIGVLSALVAAVFQIFVYNQVADFDPEADGGERALLIDTISSAFTTVVATLALGAVLTGMLTVVITQDVIGSKLTLGEVWVQVRPRLLKLIGLSLTLTLLMVLGIIPCLTGFLWLYGVMAVAVPAFMVEKLKVFEAMRRSMALVKGTFWRILGIRLLGWLLVTFVAGVIVVPIELFASAVGGVDSFGGSGIVEGVPYLYIVLSSIGTVIATTLTAPISAGIDSLLYVDLRMRKEGLDIALQQAAADRAREASGAG